MSPNKREREYARRRYEKWQGEVSQREANLRQARRSAIAAVSAVAAVLAVVGIVSLVLSGRGAAPVTAATTPTATGTGAGVAASSPATPSPCTKAPTANGSPSSWSTVPDKSLAGGHAWTLKLETNCGPITIKLDGAKAPQAVAATVFLAQHGFWNTTSCHRLTTSGIYVLQCGDPTGSGSGGPGFSYGPIENAPATGLYPAGTVAMARASSPSSMGSQFFLVYKDTTLPTDTGGYTVLGQITSGLDTVTKVAAGGTVGGGDGPPNWPVSILAASIAAD